MPVSQATRQRNGIRPANVLSHAALFDQACEVGRVDSGQRVSRHDHLFDAG